MAHEIETVAWRGNPPWHKLGVSIDDEQDPAKICKMAGLDWNVSKRPTWTTRKSNYGDEPTAVDLLVPNVYALVRDKDNQVLGQAGPKYQPFQNNEVMDLFRNFTAAGNMSIEVAGSLKGGRIIWVLAKVSEGTFSVLGSDLNFSYLLLYSPHIWGKSLDLLFTAVRVVCWNTLTQALAKKVGDRFRLIHNKGFAAMRETAEMAVENVIQNQQIFAAKAERMANAKVKDIKDVIRYYNQLTIYSRSKKLKEAKGVISSDEIMNSTGSNMLANFRFGPGSELETAKDTWWGVYNGLSFFIDHQAGRRGRDEALYNAWLSSYGAVTKRRAFDLALQYAEAA